MRLLQILARALPRTLLMAAAAALLSPAAAAQQAPPTSAAAPSPAATGYNVEIIVFRNGGVQGVEDLNAPGRRGLTQDTDSSDDAARNVRLLQVLPASRYKLGDVAARLNASGGHRTLARAAWTQTASAWNSRSGIPAEQLGLGSAGLSGVVYLERGQYLHLGFNLSLASSEGRYSLEEIRRVRLNERNYFDHPGFGIIAIVTPATAAATP